MSDKLTLKLNADSELQIDLTKPNVMSLKTETPTSGWTRDYNRLVNKPLINDQILQGNMTSTDLRLFSENTVEGWSAMSLYVPKVGEICLYSDLSKIKIGDGSVPIVDLPFINSEDMANIERAIIEHTDNNQIHVTTEDRQFWNAKLNYTINGEELILNRN